MPNYGYRLLIGGRTVAQCTQIDYREGNDGGLYVTKIPGTYKVPDVTLKRGVIQDATFASWLKGARMKHDAVLQTIDDAGRPLASYPLSKCWVTKYTGPTLGGQGNDVAFQELEITPENLVIGLPKKK
jgi:phage tail-like protein